MQVLVTGHSGYIGVHLVELLQLAGHHVVGCDLKLFQGCEWERCPQPERELVTDVRRLAVGDLHGIDVVCHLAAISNDPMGDLNVDVTYDINRDASFQLAKVAKSAGVKRFLFAGSCSVYGKGKKLDLQEDDPLQPLTAYARSKIEAEAQIADLADEDFSPVFLRNATAYGHSPMLRIDLVVNNLLASAVAYGEIRIMSDGSPWRPLIHCRDIARAFLALAECPPNVLHNQAVNVGADSENYQVREIAKEVQRLIPEATIRYTGEVGEDPRNYRVSFAKLHAELPGFELEYNLRKGMEHLYSKLVEHDFDERDFEGDRFVRMRMLKKRLDRLAVDLKQNVAID